MGWTSTYCVTLCEALPCSGPHFLLCRTAWWVVGSAPDGREWGRASILIGRVKCILLLPHLNLPQPLRGAVILAPHTGPQLTNAYLRLKGQLSVLYPLRSIGTLGMAQVGHCAGGSGLQGQPAGQEEGRTVFAFGDQACWGWS